MLAILAPIPTPSADSIEPVTTTQNPAVRFLYVLISFLLQNAWRYLHWEYVASPRRGARRL